MKFLLIEYLYIQIHQTRSYICTHIALDQTVVPSRSETDNEVDVHAGRAIANHRNDAKFSWQF